MNKLVKGKGSPHRLVVLMANILGVQRFGDVNVLRSLHQHPAVFEQHQRIIADVKAQKEGIPLDLPDPAKYVLLFFQVNRSSASRGDLDRISAA